MSSTRSTASSISDRDVLMGPEEVGKARVRPFRRAQQERRVADGLHEACPGLVAEHIDELASHRPVADAHLHLDEFVLRECPLYLLDDARRQPLGCDGDDGLQAMPDGSQLSITGYGALHGGKVPGWVVAWPASVPAAASFAKQD